MDESKGEKEKVRGWIQVSGFVLSTLTSHAKCAELNLSSSRGRWREGARRYPTYKRN